MFTRNIPEGHHCANDATCIAQGSGNVIHRKADAILAPEDLIASVIETSFLDDTKNFAILFRKRASIGLRMMNRRVLRSADQIVNSPTEHVRRGQVNEDNPAIDTNPMYALTDGFKNGFSQPIWCA